MIVKPIFSIIIFLLVYYHIIHLNWSNSLWGVGLFKLSWPLKETIVHAWLVRPDQQHRNPKWDLDGLKYWHSVLSTLSETKICNFTPLGKRMNIRGPFWSLLMLEYPPSPSPTPLGLTGHWTNNEIDCSMMNMLDWYSVHKMYMIIRIV